MPYQRQVSKLSTSLVAICTICIPDPPYEAPLDVAEVAE